MLLLQNDYGGTFPIYCNDNLNQAFNLAHHNNVHYLCPDQMRVEVHSTALFPFWVSACILGQCRKTNRTPRDAAKAKGNGANAHGDATTNVPEEEDERNTYVN
jgi:hypothetical protein